MILLKTNKLDEVKSLNPLFNELFVFLKNNDLSKLDPGKIVVKGDELYINLVDIDTKTKDEQVLESHKDYIDVHFPLSQKEIIGWKDINDCKDEIQSYSKEGDYALHKDIPSTYVDVNPGECLIVFPDDAHAPAIGKGKLLKAIAKVKC